MDLQSKAEENDEFVEQLKRSEESVEALQQIKTRHEATMKMMVDDHDNLLNEKNELAVLNQSIQAQEKELTSKCDELCRQNSEMSSLLTQKEDKLSLLKQEKEKSNVCFNAFLFYLFSNISLSFL